MKYLATALIVAGLGFLPGPDLLCQVAPPNSSSSSTGSGPVSALKKDVLSLVQAKVADPVILSYIRRNAVPGHRISSQDVVELKQAGASDAVLTALMEATATASGQAVPPSGSAGGSSTTVYPENSTTYVYSYPAYPYGYDYGSYWPYYPYGYPYWGFGVSVPLFFHDHDGHFHHDHFSHVDHFHGGHFGAGAAPHGGFGSHGGAGHGGGHR